MRRGPERVAAIAGTVTALLCAPPIAGALFSTDVLLTADLGAMWLWTVALLVLSWCVVDRIGRRQRWVVGVFLSLLSLVGVELVARTYLQFDGDARRRLARFAWMTYREQSAYQPHPFVHYTGRPDVRLIGSEALRGRRGFNRYGFHGRAVPREKPAGTVRIACLGGSTTASGYPEAMERWLRDQEDAGTRWECMNFGHGFYTSAHSLMNFALNVLGHDVDYVVFHHGWNEARCAENGAAFRGDYAHRFKAFEYPDIPDALLIRASTIYRFVKLRLFDDAEWRYLHSALFKPLDPDLGVDREAALQAFERNVRAIVDLCSARHITPVLVTQPHSTDPDITYAYTAPDMTAFGARLRRIAAGYGDDVLLVDLDEKLTGHANHLFKDVGHMTDAGIVLKAIGIGAAIRGHRGGR